VELLGSSRHAAGLLPLVCVTGMRAARSAIVQQAGVTWALHEGGVSCCGCAACRVGPGRVSDMQAPTVNNHVAVVSNWPGPVKVPSCKRLRACHATCPPLCHMRNHVHVTCHCLGGHHAYGVECFMHAAGEIWHPCVHPDLVAVVRILGGVVLVEQYWLCGHMAAGIFL
jgi:hypothetical protein